MVEFPPGVRVPAATLGDPALLALALADPPGTNSAAEAAATDRGVDAPELRMGRKGRSAYKDPRQSDWNAGVRELTVGLEVLLVSPGIALRAGHARTDTRCPGTRTCRRSVGFGTADGTRSLLLLLQVVQSLVWWAESELESRRRSVGRWQSLPSLDLAFLALVSRSSCFALARRTMARRERRSGRRVGVIGGLFPRWGLETVRAVIQYSLICALVSSLS